MKDELRKAIAEAAQIGGLLLKSQMAFDFTASAKPAHHVAYLRTNARGTTSRIEAKGSPTAKDYTGKELKAGDVVEHIHTGEIHHVKGVQKGGKHLDLEHPRTGARHIEEAKLHNKVDPAATQHGHMVKELRDAYAKYDRVRGGFGITTVDPDYATPERYKETAERILRYKSYQSFSKRGQEEIKGILERHIAELSPKEEQPVTVQQAQPHQGHRVPSESESITQAREAGRKAGTTGYGAWQNPHRDAKHAQAWHDGHSEGLRDWIDAGHSAQQTREYETIRADAEARRSRRPPPQEAHQAQRTRVEAERAAAIAMVKPQMTLAEIKAAIYTQHVSTEDFIGDLKVGQTTTLKTANGRQRVKIIEDSPVSALITQVETAAQGLLTNPAMEPHRHDITEMLKDLKAYPSARHAQVVIKQLQEMAEEAKAQTTPDPDRILHGEGPSAIKQAYVDKVSAEISRIKALPREALLREIQFASRLDTAHMRSNSLTELRMHALHNKYTGKRLQSYYDYANANRHLRLPLL